MRINGICCIASAIRKRAATAESRCLCGRIGPASAALVAVLPPLEVLLSLPAVPPFSILPAAPRARFVEDDLDQACETETFERGKECDVRFKYQGPLKFAERRQDLPPCILFLL